jgi:capsule polysaccharide export protein KpsC/LpsZ
MHMRKWFRLPSEPEFDENGEIIDMKEWLAEKKRKEEELRAKEANREHLWGKSARSTYARAKCAHRLQIPMTMTRPSFARSTTNAGRFTRWRGSTPKQVVERPSTRIPR